MRLLVAMAVVSAMVSAAHAGLVWESTFPDGDTDGVAQFKTNTPGSAIIGSSAGDTQVITVRTVDDNTPNRAGRALGDTKAGGDAFSGLFSFEFSRLEAAGAGAEVMAGFFGSDGGYATRQMLGAGFTRETSGGDEYIRFIARFAGDGYIGSGRMFSPQISMGTLVGKNLQLAVGYDGTTSGDERMSVGLFDGDTGEKLLEVSDENFDGTADCDSTAGCRVRYANNIGVTPEAAALGTELTNLRLDRLGWGDMTVDRQGTEWDFKVDSLAYYDDARGAFNNVVPEPASLSLLGLAGLMALVRRKRA